MRDSIWVSVESEDEAESAHIHDDAGEVAAGDATFRFSIDGTDIEDAGKADSADMESRPHTADTGLDDDRDPCYIAPVTEIPTDSTLRCEAVNGRRGTEIILRREDTTTVFAWRNSCPHEPNIPLDPGGGAIVDDEQLVCHEHGARFECGDGFCTDGPCRGDALDPIGVAVRDGDVYLADERFEACTRLR